MRVCRQRALLNWSAADLAAAGGFGIMTVKRFEGGQAVSASSIDRIIATLTTAGITFVAKGETSRNGGEGVHIAPISLV